MPAKNKARGNAFERLVVAKARKKGLHSIRAWGSDGRSMGMSEKVDLIIEDKKVQAKKRKTLPQYLEIDEEIDIVVFNTDYKPPKVLIYLDDYLDMLDELKELSQYKEYLKTCSNT